MSTVVAKPAAPRRGAGSRLLRLWTSTIGLKILMALTGVLLTGFVLVHMLGNLQVFQGSEAINAYGRLLRVEPALLWTARLVLLSAVGLHIVAWLALFRRNQGARTEGYRVVKRRESSLASRTMRYTGPLLLLFIIYHILHLTTGTVHADYHEGDVYNNLVTGLSNVVVAAIYVVAMLLLGFHLWHGVWSMFQTLGANQPRYNSLGRRFATALTVVVVLGFAAVPLAVVSGVVRPAPAPDRDAQGRGMTVAAPEPNQARGR